MSPTKDADHGEARRRSSSCGQPEGSFYEQPPQPVHVDHQRQLSPVQCQPQQQMQQPCVQNAMSPINMSPTQCQYPAPPQNNNCFVSQPHVHVQPPTCGGNAIGANWCNVQMVPAECVSDSVTADCEGGDYHVAHAVLCYGANPEITSQKHCKGDAFKASLFIYLKP